MVIISCILCITAIIYFFSVSYLLFGLFRLQSSKNKSLFSYSVVIAVHNEENNLEKCLDCLISQDYPADKFEVILADDRSTDSTLRIIKKYCDKYANFKYVEVKQSEIAVPKKTALIKALEIAHGEIILSTDGDCIQPRGWISSVNHCFADGVGMVIGHVGYFKPENIWQGIDALDYLTHRALGAAFIGIKSVYTCTAANMAYRKEIFDLNKDGFRKLKVRPAEDNFILHCTKKSGLKIVVATEADSRVETSGAQSFSHFFNQRFRWAAYGGNITTLGVKLFFIPALSFYLIILVSLFASMFYPKILLTLGLVCLGKILFDLLLIARYTFIYKIGYMLKYFLPLSVIHLILSPLVAIKGNLFTFKWKSRRYTKEHEIRERVTS